MIAFYRGEVVRQHADSAVEIVKNVLAVMNGSSAIVVVSPHGHYKTVINRGSPNTRIMYCGRCDAITYTLDGIEADNHSTCFRCGHRQPAVVRKPRKPYTRQIRS